MGVELPKTLVKRLRIAAASQGTSASALAAEAITHTLAKTRKNKPYASVLA